MSWKVSEGRDLRSVCVHDEDLAVRNGRRFVFERAVNRAALEANLTPTAGNTYSLKIEGAGARNRPGANPVEIRLGIGNNGGTVSVNAEYWSAEFSR